MLLYCFLATHSFAFLGALFHQYPLLSRRIKAGDTMIGYLQAAVALGIGIGSALRDSVKRQDRLSLYHYLQNLLSPAAFAFGPRRLRVLVIILTALLGIAGGFFQIPLTTAIQHRSPQDKRGRYLAAGNALDSISMLLSAAVHWIFLKPLNLSPANVIVALGAIIAIVIAACGNGCTKKSTRPKTKTHFQTS